MTDDDVVDFDPFAPAYKMREIEPSKAIEIKTADAKEPFVITLSSFDKDDLQNFLNRLSSKYGDLVESEDKFPKGVNIIYLAYEPQTDDLPFKLKLTLKKTFGRKQKNSILDLANTMGLNIDEIREPGKTSYLTKKRKKTHDGRVNRFVLENAEKEKNSTVEAILANAKAKILAEHQAEIDKQNEQQQEKLAKQMGVLDETLQGGKGWWEIFP